jgi:small subunit ribosomal protein S9
MARKTKKEKYIYAVGRRKTSSARVRLFKGKGDNLVNDTSLLTYFPTISFKSKLERFFKLVGFDSDKMFFTVKVEGGGKSGQFDAVLFGLARAFAKLDPENLKPKLKKEGFLTRDARVRERRKVGTGGKARRKKQSPKR